MANNYHAPWTQDRADQAATLWKAGYSAARIAQALGGTTRNAVIGKLSRMGVMDDNNGVTRESVSPGVPVSQRRPASPKAPLRGRSGVVVVDEAERSAASALLSAVAALTPADIPVLPPPPMVSGLCRWPLGDPRRPDFRFCDEPTVGGRIYCGPHCRAAGQPDTPRVVAVVGRTARPYRLQGGAPR